MEVKLKEVGTQLPYLEMGSGFLIGLSIGYFLKKSFKVMLVLMGLVMVSLFVLENQGVVTINEHSLDNTVSIGSHAFKSFTLFLKDRLSRFSLASDGGAVVGLVTGLKWG